MTALSFLSSTFFFFIVALSFCMGIIYHSKGYKQHVVSGHYLGFLMAGMPSIYLFLFLIVLWRL